MDSEAFKNWLAGQPMDRKSQGSTASRCRRVERLTDLGLDVVVASDAKMAAVFLWLSEHAPDYVEGELTEAGAASLVSAVRTYAEFRRGRAHAASGSG